MKLYQWQSIALILLILGCLTYSKQSRAAMIPSGESDTSVQTDPTQQEIAGSYGVTGTNEDGSSYRGDLEIIKHGDVYQFRWLAGNQYDGVGIVNGNVVAVAFTGGANGQGCGVVSYRIPSAGTLDGKWGYWGLDKSGTEKAVRTAGSGLTGSYNVTGTNPNGSAYKVKLMIEAVGAGYRFVWTNGSSGFGVKQGNNVSVGFGGEKCAFVAYQITPSGTLEGIWGGYGRSSTGTERATKK
jgi:hypothetical protein